MDVNVHETNRMTGRRSGFLQGLSSLHPNGSHVFLQVSGEERAVVAQERATNKSNR